MQRVLCIERSLEQCAESGWYAYVFNLTEPLDAELAERLEPLGKAMLLSRLARPFLTVRAERLIIRGIFGDSFICVGVPERDVPEVKMPEEYINAQA